MNKQERIIRLCKKAFQSEKLLPYPTLNEAEAFGEDLNKYNTDDLCRMLYGSAMQIFQRVWSETNSDLNTWREYLLKMMHNAGIVNPEVIKVCVDKVLNQLNIIMTQHGTPLE